MKATTQNHTTRPHGHRKPNQGRTETRRSQSKPSREGVGRAAKKPAKLGTTATQAQRGRATQAVSIAPAEPVHTITLSLTGPEWRNICRAAANLRAKPHEFAHLAATDYARDALRDECLAFAVLNGIIDRFDGQ